MGRELPPQHRSEAHGASGPLDTEPYPVAPISNMAIDSFVPKGILPDLDMFSTGDIPHDCGHTVRATYQRLRASPVNSLLSAGENPTLETEILVDKVSFSKNASTSEIKVTRIEVIDSDGKKHKFTI